MKELLECKHPTAWIEFEKGMIDEVWKLFLSKGFIWQSKASYVIANLNWIFLKMQLLFWNISTPFTCNLLEHLKWMEVSYGLWACLFIVSLIISWDGPSNHPTMLECREI